MVPDNQIASVRIHHGGDSDLALCADKNGRVALFELGPPRLRSVFRASRTPILYAEFSPDGRNVVTAAADGLVRVWPVDPLPVADRYRPSDRFGLTGR